MSIVNAFQPVVIAPTFNNVRTLERVLRGIDQSDLPVIVVDDGCGDGSFEILESWRRASRRRVVVYHPRNRGKAAALRTGFEAARQMGYTHAITIDTDGQLDPAEIRNLSRIGQEFPDSLVLGCRPAMAENDPRLSRLGRWTSNVLLRWEAGVTISDSQCGFRVYPLRSIDRINCFSSRYGFETEILVRAAWAGLPIRECPVGCIYAVPEGRVSHFRPWRDSLRCGGMHVRLLVRSMMPISAQRTRPSGDLEAPAMIWQRLLRSFNPVALIRAMRHSPAERTGFSKGLAIGVFIANTPLYGFHSLLSLYAARCLRLNPMPVLFGSHLSSPAFGPMLIAAAITIGHLLLYGTLPPMRHFNPSIIGYLALARSVILEWTIGGAVLGAILGMIAYIISALLIRCVPLSRPANSAIDPAAPAPVHAPAVAESAV